MLKSMSVRLSLVVLACMVSATALAVADQAKMVNVRAGDLIEGLESLAKQCGVDVIYPSSQLKGLKTSGVSGTLEPKEAFKKLIEGTPLTIKEEGGAVLITLPNSDSPSSSTSPDTAAHGQQKEGKGNSSALFLLAQESSGQAPGGVSVGNQEQPASKTQSAVLEEVIVTAQKREERLQDVPVPVSTVSADYLLANNKLGLLDYSTEVPGLTVTGSPGLGFQSVAIRGIVNYSNGTQTTAVLVDDLPITAGSLNNAGFVPDIDPGSLSRVEFLRGPQGTLYGANTLGGLIKYVTLDPSRKETGGYVMAGTETIEYGTGLGYTFRGALNLPLGGDWAMRVGAFSKKDPGYIDNPAIGINGINALHGEGGNLSVLWQPTDDLSLRLTAILQRYYQDAGTFSNLGSNPAIPGFPAPVGNFQQVVINQIPVESKAQVYGAVLKDRFGSVDLNVVTGYIVNSLVQTGDVSGINGLTQPIFGVEGVALQQFGRLGKFNQEVRLSGPLTEHFDFLLGGVWTYEDDQYRIRFPATDPVSGEEAGLWSYQEQPGTYSELAGFADVTWHATKQFDVQLGARVSQIKQTFATIVYNVTPSSGPCPPPNGGFYTFNCAIFGSPESVFSPPKVHFDDTPVTYLVTPSFRICPDMMVYARVASGYRPGGPNIVYGGVPPSYRPDKTTNYDLGLKTDFLHHRLSFDLSAYYIDWKNVQIVVANSFNGISYTSNGAGAKSQGVELSIEARPLQSLILVGWVAWDEAVITQGYPLSAEASATIATEPGDPLPYVPRFSAHASAREEFALPGGMTGFVGAQVSYVDDRKDSFQAPAQPGSPATPRIDLPAYAKVDVQGGARYGRWSVNVYANNVTNRLGVITGGVEAFMGTTTFIQPRTVGMNLQWSF
jgi:outer membrane receptor protein involved in Fe transport